MEPTDEPLCAQCDLRPRVDDWDICEECRQDGWDLSDAQSLDEADAAESEPG